MIQQAHHQCSETRCFSTVNTRECAWSTKCSKCQWRDNGSVQSILPEQYSPSLTGSSSALSLFHANVSCRNEHSFNMLIQPHLLLYAMPHCHVFYILWTKESAFSVCLFKLFIVAFIQTKAIVNISIMWHVLRSFLSDLFYDFTIIYWQRITMLWSKEWYGLLWQNNKAVSALWDLTRIGTIHIHAIYTNAF